MLLSTSLLVLSALTRSVLGQTHTDCNPTKKSCPADTALSTSYYSHNFKDGADNDNWKMTSSGVNYTANGAEFTISKQGDSPTIQSNWYIFFGSVSFLMRTAPGTGIVSSAILQSDDLDEIDWEWLGGQPAEVQTNYFSKGNTATYNRMAKASIPSGNAETTLHNYTIAWTKTSMQWIIDSNVVRQVTYADVNSAYGYPQTPMNVRIGIWAGGDPSNEQGTIEWAGGETDYTKGPYTMVIEKVEVVNYAPAKEYSYGDMSGGYESIVVVDGKGDTSSSVKASSSASATKSATSTKSMATSASGSASTSVSVSAEATTSAVVEGKSGETTKALDSAAAATVSALPVSNAAGGKSVQWVSAALLGVVAAGLAL